MVESFAIDDYPVLRVSLEGAPAPGVEDSRSAARPSLANSLCLFVWPSLSALVGYGRLYFSYLSRCVDARVTCGVV